MKCYRCGWCGQPCDDSGEPLAMWQIAVMNPFVDWDNAEQEPGDCCRHKYEQQQVQVTREMALDAECPEMEGTFINW